MNTNKMNTPTDKKDQWEANKTEFNRLCTEQEGLYCPEFEKVFAALYEIAPDQREVYNTNGWNVGADLPERINAEAINEALQAVGVVGEMADNFKRYAEIVLQGKKLMQQSAFLNVEIEMPQATQEQPPEGWRFCPIHILAPQQLHTAICDEVERQALNGEGLFAHNTEIDELPDEALDELFGVEVYNVVCSLQPFHGELRRYGVTGQTLGKDFTRYLFAYLKKIADHIKANTDKPEAVKSYILEAIKNLDGVHVWGVLFQILILDGLCYLLENCTLKEGDNGYNEAQDLGAWLLKILVEKLVQFTFTPYGVEDKQRLQPLCDYLYNTEIGRAVQERIFGRGKPTEQADTADQSEAVNLPSELDTDRARKYFTRAIEAGWMSRTASGYNWTFGGSRGAKARLGYFVVKIYCPTNTEQIPESAINKLFGVSRIASAITQAFNANKPQKWRTEIDNKIFFD